MNYWHGQFTYELERYKIISHELTFKYSLVQRIQIKQIMAFIVLSSKQIV